MRLVFLLLKDMDVEKCAEVEGDGVGVCRADLMDNDGGTEEAYPRVEFELEEGMTACVLGRRLALGTRERLPTTCTKLGVPDAA